MCMDGVKEIEKATVVKRGVTVIKCGVTVIKCGVTVVWCYSY